MKIPPLIGFSVSSLVKTSSRKNDFPGSTVPKVDWAAGWCEMGIVVEITLKKSFSGAEW